MTTQSNPIVTPGMPFRLGIVHIEMGTGPARQLLIAAPYTTDLCRKDSRLFRNKEALYTLPPEEVDAYMLSDASDDEVLLALEDRIIELGCEVVTA